MSINPIMLKHFATNVNIRTQTLKIYYTKLFI